MKILSVLVGATTRTGGPPAFVGGAARALERLGHTMPIRATDMAMAPHGLWQRDQRAAHAGELHPDLTGEGLQLFPTREPRRMAYSPALRQALRQDVPAVDLVHIHNLWLYPQFVAYRAARASAVPYVVSPHGAFDAYLRQTGRGRKAVTMALWQRRLLEGAALLHVTTRTEERVIADIAPHVPRAVVPCGISTQEFQVLPPRAAFRASHMDGYDGPLVVFLGRVTDKKGTDVLIRAFARARAQVDCRLAIVGPDDEGLTPTLVTLARELGVHRDVAFTGPLYGQERLEALAAADVWALSSHTENFGIAVVEAMAAGCAVVISPGVNIAGEIGAANAGLVRDATPEAFGRGLLEVIGDTQRRADLEAAARKFAARYDWGVVGPQLAAAYSSALGATGT